MTDAEKKQVLQLVFAEVSADHTAENVLVQLKPRPMWEPYVEAVLARQKAPGSAASADTTPERKTGLYGRGVATVWLAQDERGWLRIA